MNYRLRMRTIRDVKNISGFTLIQVSIILVLASLTMVAVLPSYQLSLKSNSASVNKMNAIMTSLRQFQTANGRLPCPANAAYGNNDNNYGKEAANPGSTTNCSGGTPTANFVDSTNKVAIGMLPVQSLQLPADYALDGYGRKLTYAVDTNATGCWASQSLNGKIIVADNGINYNSVVTIASHGADGHGAWLPLPGTGLIAGRLDGGVTGTDSLINAHLTAGTFPTNAASAMGTSEAGASATFVKKLPISGFDDTVTYRNTVWSQNLVPASLLTATSISAYPGNRSYGSGESLTFVLTFPQAVTVTGTPRLALSALDPLNNNIGTSNVAYANYVAGTNPSTMHTFTYNIQAADVAASGIRVLSPVNMNGGFINPCLTFYSTPDLSGVIIGSYIYVADVGRYRVLKLDMNGAYKAQIGLGSSSTKNGNFSIPAGIAIDTSGNVWVNDSGTVDRVQKLTSSGVWQMSIGGKSGEACGGIYATASSCTNISGYTNCCAPNAASCTCGYGNATTPTAGNAQFNYGNEGLGMAFDSGGDIWVADTQNDRIIEFYTSGSNAGVYKSHVPVVKWPKDAKFDSSGNMWVISPGFGNCALQKCTYSGSWSCSTVTSGCGTTNGKFYDNQYDADYIAIDNSTNTIWVSDQSNCRIQQFNSSGVWQKSISLAACNFGNNSGASGIVADGNGYLWVTNTNDESLNKINASTGSTTTITTFTSSPTTMNNPMGIAIGR